MQKIHKKLDIGESKKKKILHVNYFFLNLFYCRASLAKSR